MLTDMERLSYQFDNQLGNARGIIHTIGLRQHDKLITPYTGDRIRGAQTLGQTLTDLIEQLVADRMTKGIIDLLEAIKIKKHQREYVPIAPGLSDALLDPIFQQHAVGQLCQGVVQCQMGQLAVGPGQRDAGLTRRRPSAVGIERGTQYRRAEYGQRQNPEGQRQVVDQWCA